MRIKASDLRIVVKEGRSFLVAEIDPSFVGAARQNVDEFSGKNISIEPKRWQEDRSVRSNAYLHE